MHIGIPQQGCPGTADLSQGHNSPGLKSDILRRNFPLQRAATSCINAYLHWFAADSGHNCPFDRNPCLSIITQGILYVNSFFQVFSKFLKPSIPMISRVLALYCDELMCTPKYTYIKGIYNIIISYKIVWFLKKFPQNTETIFFSVLYRTPVFSQNTCHIFNIMLK